MQPLQNIQPRKYQQEIFESCKKSSCLVILPTGIGKTLIALMLAIEKMRTSPAKKVLFLAPTRPLAQQHLTYFKKHLPELYATLELFTGQTAPEKRQKLWQNADVIFSTPQCIGNDVKNNLYDLKPVSLLIEDEAHRCLKNYSYTYVAKIYKEQSSNPHILGLTASPGSDKKTIKEICKNLGIEKIEVRTRESDDVKEYLQELEFEVIKLDFPPFLEDIRQKIKIIYDKKIEELKKRQLLFSFPTKITLLETQARIMRTIASGNKNMNLFAGASACATAIKLGHLLELLETQTIYSTNIYIQDLIQQGQQQKSRAASQLIKKPEFMYVDSTIKKLIQNNIEHPKLERLKELVEAEIKANSKAKIIVFSQYRDTVTRICRELNHIPNIKAKVFIGQAKKSRIGKQGEEEQTGLSQKEQKEIIHEFSLGEINVLCATSIHPEEYIVLKKDNKIIIQKIGDFVDSFIKNNNKAFSKKITGWEALTSNGKNLSFKPITNVHRHKTQNNTVRIKLSSGFDCSITENHSLFSFNNKNNFIPTVPEKNKFVAIGLKCPNPEIYNKIDIIKELRNNCSKEELKKLFGSLSGLTQAKIRILKTHLWVLSKLSEARSITSLSKIIKRDYSTIMNSLKRLKKQEYITQKREKKNYKNLSKITGKGIEYLKFLKWFFKNVKYRKGKYRFKLLNIPENKEEFNQFFEQNANVNYGKTRFPRFLELNESLARFLGFYVSEGSTRKTKSTSDVFLAAKEKEMQEMMRESIQKGLELKPRINWRGLALDSQITYHLIKSVFKAGIGAYNKEVPEIIFTAPSNIKWEFLKAYFLGDGYSDENRITFTTVSRKLVVGLNLLLRMLGIEKITLYKQRDIYRLYVFESLPFAKIKEKNEKRGHAYYSLTPIALKSEKAFKKYNNFFRYSPEEHPKCRENGKWDSDVCFDYIKEIEKIDKPNFVYDLSVKETENFIGGTGLFCLHNSIGEEGLDIPEVNAVIFYEPIPSAIRTIQRRGRTARLMKGKLIILLTKNTRDESYYWAAFHKEKRMYKALENINEELENYLKENNKQERLFK